MFHPNLSPIHYYHDIPVDLVPAGVTPKRFSSYLNPEKRDEVLKSLAFSPHTISEAEVPLLTLGSAMIYALLIPYRSALRASLASVLRIPQGYLKISLLRRLKPIQGHAPLQSYPRPSPRPSQKVICELDARGRSVIVNTKFDVIISTLIAPTLKDQFSLSTELWNIIDASSYAKVLRPYGINFCELPIIEGDVPCTRWKNRILSTEEIEAIQDREHEKMMDTLL